LSWSNPLLTKVVSPIFSSLYPSAVAGFYRYWHNLEDEEVIGELKRHGKQVGRDTNDA
jgi:hypothetical protein